MIDRRQFLGAGALWWLGCDGTRVAATRVDARPPDTARDPLPAGDGRPPALVAEVAPFAFHSGFWLNLHHFLYAQAAGENEALPNAAEIARDADALGAEGRAALADGVNAYRARFGTRDLLFDDQLGAIKASLAAGEMATAPPVPPAETALGELLARAAGPYGAGVWPKHDAENRRWVAAASETVRAHGAGIMADLARWYRAPWPAGQVRVDVCRSANWAGAYTSLAPVLIVIASADARNQDSYALEILFHESSHAMMGPLRAALAAECARQGKAEPRNLWHAILFYSSGAAVAARVPGHVPYVDRENIWRHGWQAYRPALAAAWQPYMDGKRTFEAALAELVRTVA